MACLLANGTDKRRYDCENKIMHFITTEKCQD